MKKIIFAIMLLTQMSYGQFVNTNTKAISYKLPNILYTENGIIDFPSSNTLYEAGWRSALKIIQTNFATNQIPLEIQQTANKYTNILNSIFGDGAHTNTQFTEAYVATALALDDNSDLNLAIRLKALFDILNEYWARGEVWSFPYGQNQYTSSYVSVTWFPVED